MGYDPFRPIGWLVAITKFYPKISSNFSFCKCEKNIKIKIPISKSFLPNCTPLSL